MACAGCECQSALGKLQQNPIHRALPLKQHSTFLPFRAERDEAPLTPLVALAPILAPCTARASLTAWLAAVQMQAMALGV